MVAHELVSKYGRAYLTPRCLLKVDIRKAFDSVNCDFLRNCMLNLKYPPLFVDWIMACVSSPYYSLHINGGLKGFFPGKRGLRQGDPLSPYLFVLCIEVLSRILRKLPKFDNFSYHPKCVQLNLTHLIFVDDLLVFTRGDLPSVAAVASCLETFDRLSELQANPSKTCCYMF
ncbi:secreted RxLR effector protein 78-like [Silene latifolia]|uniref:secreted RxLR effector protein 78-like n=1 Tax=Silene latifolia TaxID=37657 RepID=UPI003D76FA82